MRALRLEDRAAENLRFIRDTMERAGAFTAVPGRGMAAIGVSALIAAAVAPAAAGSESWLRLWLGEAALALLVGGWALVRKARALRMPLLSGPGRRFFLAFAPPLAAGAGLTAVLMAHGLGTLLPGLWLLLYGTAVVAGGALSVRIVPLMGGVFALLGALALALPATGPVLLGVGFGGLHLVFGALIARGHGG